MPPPRTAFAHADASPRRALQTALVPRSRSRRRKESRASRPGVRRRATSAALSPRPLVNSPVPPSAAERLSLARLAAWLLVAIVVAAGVYFYFRHTAEVAPLLDSVRRT